MKPPEGGKAFIVPDPRAAEPAVFMPGYRMSWLDAGFLALVSTLSVVAFVHGSTVGWIIAAPTAQFFLFCNVFRTRRILELLWAGTYVAITVGVVATGLPDWVAASGGGGFGALLIALDMRHPSYHGVLWRRLNPLAESWFNRRIAAPER